MAVSDQQLAIDDYGTLRYINGVIFTGIADDGPR